MAIFNVTNTGTATGGAGPDTLNLTYNTTSNGVWLQNITGNLATGYSGMFDGYGLNNTVFSGIEHFGFTDASGGDDIIVTGDGNDTVNAGGGDDIVNGGGGVNLLDGGAGVDQVGSDHSTVSSNLTVNLNGASTILGTGGISNFEGFLNFVTGSGNDRLTGHQSSGSSDILASGKGADLISLWGGGSDDVDGGAGKDRLSVTWSMASDGVWLQNIVETGNGHYSGMFDGLGLNNVKFQNIEHFSFIDQSGGDDIIRTGKGNDKLNGGAGDDFLDGGSGRDTLIGGAGKDRYGADQSGLTSDVTIDLNTVSTVNGGKVRQFEAFSGVSTGSGDDTIINHKTSRMNDILNTNGGDDTITLYGGGSDTIFGGTGDDHLRVIWNSPSNGVWLKNIAADTVNGGYKGTFDGVGRNNIQFSGIEHFTFIDKNGGHDDIQTGAGDDRLIGGKGHDILNGGSGVDYLDGGAGADRYYADHSAITSAVTLDLNKFSKVNGGVVRNFEQIGGLSTGSGNDRIKNHQSSGLFDNINTGAGNDRITLHSGGADYVNGGTGNDRLTLNWNSASDGVWLLNLSADATNGGYKGVFDGIGQNNVNFFGIEHFSFIDTTGGDDIIKTGNGVDDLSGGGGNDRLDAGGNRDMLFGDDGNDSLSGGAGFDHLYGGKGNDSLRGDNGADSLFGDAGRDKLLGGNGDDLLTGGNGNDTLNGGKDDDSLFGGTGIDTFVYNGGADIIGDFNGDKLKLDDALWGAATLTTAQILAYATVVDTDTLFNFGGGNTLTLWNYTDVNGLGTALEIF
ncbi:MAG: hypothetical protein GJ676_20365 [Rhodobacteraceae bacterium]|nr:hypothetical protein [Paracoccaceae bacterium]